MTPRPPRRETTLLDAADWAATPLGPSDAWPPDLRAIVELIAAAPTAMAVVWGEALVPIHNAAFAALFALAPTAQGIPLRQAAAPRPFDAAACERARAGAAVTEDGGAAALAYSPVRDAAGAIAGVLVTPTAPTVTPPADLAQLMNEARARLAIEASSAGAWAWDARTNEATWDDCYHAAYGFAPGEPRTHEAWLARLHPDDRARVEARLNTVGTTPGDDEWNLEFRAVVPGRGVVWMQGLGRALRGPDGAIRSMTGINLDITARKRIEQQLRVSEEQLRLFFDYAPAAAAMFDRDLRYVAVSRRWLSDFGVGDDIIGRFHYEVFPEIPERWRAVHRRCLAGAVEAAEEDSVERADGSIQWLKWQVHPWRNDAGEIGGIIIVSEDITAARRARERQRVLIGELQHRTRNLITVVESIAQQTMSTADSLPSFMARFGVRLRALARVQGLLSRSDREPITLGGLVRMELDALGSDAVATRATISGPEVRLRKRDVQTLALAIHELATNACKYGALAGDRGRLAVCWRIEQGTAGGPELELEWTESGIDAPPAPRPGYGWALIEHALPYSLAAPTRIELGADTFRCAIRLPVHDPAEDDDVPELDTGAAEES